MGCGASKKSPPNVTMVGLDGAGKTTLLYQARLNTYITTIPTIGFNVETVESSKRQPMVLWDVGGQDKMRPLWRHYYANTQGILFVVDCTDQERLEEAREALLGVLENTNAQEVPLVVIVNKQDLPDAASPAEVAKALNLRDIKDRKWHIQGTSATENTGIVESLQALEKLIKINAKKK